MCCKDTNDESCILVCFGSALEFLAIQLPWADHLGGVPEVIVESLTRFSGSL